MTEHTDIKKEIKENTRRWSGINNEMVGAMVLIINELRILNENIEKLSKRITSDVI